MKSCNDEIGKETWKTDTIMQARKYKAAGLQQQNKKNPVSLNT